MVGRSAVVQMCAVCGVCVGAFFFIVDASQKIEHSEAPS